MNSFTDRSSSPSTVDGDELVDIVLRGGPDGLPHEHRTQRLAARTEKVKVPYYGGYEHFVRSESTDGAGSPIVYEWAGRTRVAE